MHHTGDEHVLCPGPRWQGNVDRFNGAIIRLVRPHPDNMVYVELRTKVEGNSGWKPGFKFNAYMEDLGERVYNARTGERTEPVEKKKVVKDADKRNKDD